MIPNDAFDLKIDSSGDYIFDTYRDIIKDIFIAKKTKNNNRNENKSKLSNKFSSDLFCSF